MPEVYVKRIVKGEKYEKKIEFRTVDSGKDGMTIPGKGDAKM